MKTILKKSISFLSAILFLILNTYTFSAINKNDIKTFLPVATAIQSDNESKDEGDNDFNFIKSNENVRDFLYDGSLLLYGGIALISLSVIGMVITFLPRRRKKRRTRKSNLNRHARK